jgi:DNA polymerase-3 subunit delta
MAPLYAIHGAEPLLALEAADRIRESARKSGCSEREIFFAEPGVDWNKLGASAANLSLFASRRLVELRIPTGKPGTEGGRAIEAWCAKLPEDAVSLVLLPELDWQQLKTKWFEAIDRAGVVVEAKPVTRDELPDWLAERLARQAQRASVETLEWLADRVEGNLLAAKQEVEKLALLLPAGEITLAAIRDSVTDVARFERDTLIDAIHADDASRIARVVASLQAEGEPLPLLLWTLAEELRLLMAVSAGQRPRRFLPPERMERIGRTARKHSAASFDRELLRAHRIDRMIKGVETGNPWDSVVDLALGIAGRPALVDAAA